MVHGGQAWRVGPVSSKELASQGVAAISSTVRCCFPISPSLCWPATVLMPATQPLSRQPAAGAGCLPEGQVGQALRTNAVAPSMRLGLARKPTATHCEPPVDARSPRTTVLVLPSAESSNAWSGRRQATGHGRLEGIVSGAAQCACLHCCLPQVPEGVAWARLTAKSMSRCTAEKIATPGRVTSRRR